ncbi:hypothetical protein SDC9_145707 [bioreactor metagenome]|uniref:Uncharacterized protein n=1 Tax=bioreactor metagenome TaxID=1076179 RepID=A0A645EB35_9ZZZZ
MVTDARKVAHTAALHQNHRVLLKVMAFAADVGGDFLPVRQADAGYFTQRRVRFLRGAGGDLQADAAALRAGAQRLGFTFLRLFFASETHQLVDCRHNRFLLLLYFHRKKFT